MFFSGNHSIELEFTDNDLKRIAEIAHGGKAEADEIADLARVLLRIANSVKKLNESVGEIVSGSPVTTMQ